jgi:steroid delta-isomerase-like uncharacterized protein
MDAASVARQLIEAFNRSDWDGLRAVCSPDVVYIEKGTNRNAKGVDEIMQVAHAWRASFSDLQGNIYTAVNCGSTAVLEITWTGTNDGSMELSSGTVPATGRSVEFDNCQVFRIENDQVAEFHNYGDFLTMLTQLGLISG